MRDVLARPVVSVYLEPNRPIYAAVAVMDIVVLDIALKNEEGNAVDLTSCSVVVAAQDREKTVLYTGNIVEPLAGAVRVKVQPDVAGRYALSARVCTSDTEDVTFFLGAMSVAAEDPDAGPANSIRSLTQEMIDAKAQATSGIETLSGLIDMTTAATNSANAASSLATEAANAANTAANAANTAANAANTAANAANTAADSANTAANAANTAADSANSAANTAAAATQALGDIDVLVADRVQEANTAAANAASSAEHAALSATAAAGSDQHATQSAFAALQSALGADQSAAAALASQNAAQTAQSNAAASASAAAGSAQNAAQSAQAAATSATNAANVVTAGADITITDGPNGTRIASVTPDTFLRLSGGVLRGNVEVKTDYNDGSGNSFTGPLIRVATTNTQYGNHVAIGGGSSTVIGGGEAVAAQLNELVGTDSEDAYIVADRKVIIKTNGNTWANAKTMEFGTDGSLTVSKVNGALNGNANSATKATQDSRGQQIDSTYIKGLSVNGRTVTYTRGNGTTGSFQTQDTNTTYTLASLGAPMAPTSNNWKRINISNGRCTLPGGGTWAYAMIAQQSTATITILDKVGVAAGGTTIQTSNQTFSVGYVLVWRIA